MPDGMPHVVICNLSDEAPRSCGDRPRVPVLNCRDALTSGGATVELTTARSDADIDAIVAAFDGPARPDGLAWPASDPQRRLVIAANSDSEVRGVIRRMVRRWAPPPSRRPADLPPGRTLPDLPPVGILPMAVVKLVDELGLPRDPVDVADAVLAGRVRRFDLFRSDAGPVTLHGALMGGVSAEGLIAPWHGRVELDDTALADPADAILACAVANAAGYTRLDDAGLAGIELAPRADATSGSITVAVAVAQRAKPRFGRSRVRVEVRRASGRAVSVTPADSVPMVEDGIDATLTRKRAWWVEAGAWGIFG